MAVRIASLILICGLLLNVSESTADTGGVVSEPVYVVDMQRVVSNSRAGKKAQEKLQSDLKQRKTEIEKMRAAFQAQQNDVRKQSAVLSEEALESRVTALRKKERELKEAADDFQAEFSRRNGVLIAKIMKEIDEILGDLSKENGYQFIIEKNDGFVVYNDQQLDLSEKVIKILDSKNVSL